MEHKFLLVSLGCPKNLVDSENMAGILTTRGYIPVEDPDDADIIIINTCSFIQDARDESIYTIFSLLEHRTDGKCKCFIICGCLVEMYRDEVIKELPEVDAVVGTGSIDMIADITGKVLSGYGGSYFSEPGSLVCDESKRFVSTAPAYAYLKIAEGCDNRCTYCVIPSLRGKFKSRPVENIIKEAESLACRGYNEIILVAQDTTRYGIDLYGEQRLYEIVTGINSIVGIKWIRILYCYPDLIDSRFVERIFSNQKMLHYLDIPLQHSSRRVLRMMGRSGDSGKYLKMIEMLREKVPDIVLRTSMITGFPGETTEDFNELCSFIKDAEFDRLGVFKYSKENNTPAARMDGQVDEEIKNERYEKLMELQKKIAVRKNHNRIGQVYDTVVEGVSEDGLFYMGRTYSDSPEIDPVVYLTTRRELEMGEYVTAKILDVDEYDLIGDVMDESAE